MEPLIRECRMEDAEFICELNRNEMGYDFPLEQTKQQLSGVRLVSGASRTGAHEFYRCCGYGGEKEQVNFKKFFNAPE
ncbi:MAG: hypothetical protein Q4C59_07695 [Lachnospiraceae bacterium]|nr:hypothetical protein [Lachnospiraceae bacterium]